MQILYVLFAQRLLEYNQIYNNPEIVVTTGHDKGDGDVSTQCNRVTVWGRLALRR